MANNKRSKASQAARRAVQNNPKAVIIAVVAVVLVIAIAFCVLYFGFPKTWDSIMASIRGDSDAPPINDASLQLPANGLTFENDDLSIHMLNVGQGDCILILFPDGKDMLIDCANYNNTTAIQQKTFAYLEKYVPDKQFDYVMLTHCDSDHVYFLDEILDEYQVDNLYMPNVLAAPEGKSDTYTKLKQQVANLDPQKLAMFTDDDTITTASYAEFFCAALTEPNCNITLNVDPDEDTNSIVITDEANELYELRFYCPTQDYYDSTGFKNGKYNGTSYKEAEYKNAISPIGILSYNGYKVVLTGDSNSINEPIFVNRIGGSLDCDILKVGHHGSETSSTDAFLDAIDCEYAFISCNASGNNFNHPRQTTLDRFIARGIAIYRTDNNGNIVFVLDAEITVYVETRVEQSTNQKGLPSPSKK
ncbi:MAG: MBL fold metallo-hydrolase [Bacteroides sp.]|nr:MBL fold metallo-hydrolase [Bacillota bacterium]MCM1393313.1 MBL fold metallo-hydrolase [[Eubacterium] siraeum]MCM1455641.1 MBL fold metallo-hydrolase [Bacteroides sp.]